jgi:hypothetical protein
MFSLKVRMLCAAAVVLVASGTGARADLIDNFNSENGGVGQLNYNSFANFFVANAVSQGGTVDLIGNGFFDFYPGNGLYIDLDGSGNGVPGLLTTNQTFAVGTYTLSFDLAGSARGVDSNVVVNFGPFSQNFFLPSSQGYTLFTETVTLTTPAQLSFQNVQPGDVGAILDNVSVISSNAAATPEPATLTLFGLGFAAIAAHGWRRRKLAVA